MTASNTTRNHPRFKDLTGQRFGQLTVIAIAGYTEKPRRALWSCKCDCGKIVRVKSNPLHNGNTASCGCSRFKHGGLGTSTYNIWQSMKQRCGNPNSTVAKHYQQRGIIVCDRWNNSFTSFIEDMGAKPDGMSLDRIDNNGNYEPSNCRWATQSQQHRNKRTNRNFTHQGHTLCLSEWAERLHMRRDLLDSRLRRGCTFEEAISRPIKARHPKHL